MEVLRRYGVLDTPPEPFFDRIVKLAAQIFQAPIATITFVDETRQWFKARYGLHVEQTARDIAFCHHTIRARDVMVVPDAHEDPRFADNPLVLSDPAIRFYAGAPLITPDGAAIGTLIVLDQAPRSDFSPRERLILRGLADMVVHELEVRCAAGDVRNEIVQRVEARTALARAGELFHMALERSPVGVFTLDRDLVYTWACNVVCGHSAEELVGHRNAEVMDVADAAFLDGLASDVIAGGDTLHAQVRCQAAAPATLLCVDYRLEPLRDAEGALQGVVGIAIDVTEETRLKRETALSRASAEAAARSKSHFLAAASHDLRQPFQAMRLFADLLGQRLGDAGDLAVLHRLNEAMQAGEDLLNAFLEISVLEAGTLKPDVSAFPIQAVTQQLVDELRALAEEKGLIMRHVMPCVDVLTDPALFRRMLRHLLVNAIRYSHRGKILLGGRRRGNSLQVQVWDTGVGIPGRELRGVFEPFYQLHNPERDRTKGLGLGLAIVDKTARLLGHGLSVRSQVGIGSVFTISVPIAPQG